MSASLAMRRLSEPLREVERRLWEWADWMQGFGESVGWPKTSVAWRLARIHETGQSFSSVTPDAEIPPAVNDVEVAVLRLPVQLQKVVLAHYFSSEPLEVKSRRAHLARPEYSRRLDNARWSLKTVLGV